MKAAFLDRDGVINVDHAYVGSPQRFEFAPDCFGSLRYLQSRGYALFVVTNQSGIARGYFSEADYRALTRWYLAQLSAHDIAIKAVYHCPHAAEDGCACRKPKPGLFLQALREYPDIELRRSLMIGDRDADAQAARAAGIQQVFLIGEGFRTPEVRSLESLSAIQGQDLL